MRHAETGFLVLADISGFTAFMAATELEHGAEITRRLLEAVAGRLAPPLRVQEIEGDAVFAVGDDRSLPRSGQEAPMPTPPVRRIQTDTLEIAAEAHGRFDAPAAILLDGFADDPRAREGVVPARLAAGHRLIVPGLRGSGPTRFLDPARPCMAQPAAPAQAVVDLMKARWGWSLAPGRACWGLPVAAVAPGGGAP